MKLGFRQLAPVLAAVLLLAGVAATRMNRPGPEDAEAYHDRVREAVAEMPDRIGPYEAEDRELPAAAYDLLKPNATRARALRGDDGRLAGSLLVVHCKDARDLLGHYPPVCYPAHGYELPETPRRVEVELEGMTIPATEYTFTRGENQRASRLVVLNFMVLPTGEIHPDDDALNRLAADYASRFYGAGQFQVIADPMLEPDARREFYATVLADVRPLIQTIRAAPVGAE